MRNKIIKEFDWNDSYQSGYDKTTISEQIEYFLKTNSDFEVDTIIPLTLSHYSKEPYYRNEGKVIVIFKPKKKTNEEKIKELIRFHISAIGATYGKDSLEPIVEQIAIEISQMIKEE